MKSKIFILFTIVGLSLSVVSCKKDYSKLTTDFIRNLSDSCEVLMKIDSEKEHLVYYKRTGDKSFYRYNVETEAVEVIVADVSNGMEVKDIFAGKENIIVCAHKWGDEYKQSAEVFLYNVENQKFEKLEDCDYYESNTGSKTIACTSVMQMQRPPYARVETIRVYDYDGKLIKEEEKEDEEARNSTAEYDDDDDENPSQVFYCDICKKRVMATEKFEADIKAGRCKPHDGYRPDGTRYYDDSHEWQYIIY